jgi:hypothetical protein
MTTTEGVQIAFDADPTFQAWNAATDKTCIALGADKCRHASNFGTKTPLAIAGTAIRISKTDAACQNAGSNDKCIISVGSQATYWEAFDDAAAPYKAMNATNDMKCVALPDSKCRKGTAD